VEQTAGRYRFYLRALPAKNFIGPLLTLTVSFSKMAININWSLNCDKDTALKLLNKAIDGPYHSNYTDTKNYKGRISGNFFSIWPKNPGLRGGPAATGKGKIVGNKDKSNIEAIIDVTAPYKYVPSHPVFWWTWTPITFLTWFVMLLGVVSEKYGHILPFLFPFTMIGIAVIVVGFMKYVGSSDLVFIHKFFRSIYSSYIVENTSETNQDSGADGV